MPNLPIFKPIKKVFHPLTVLQNRYSELRGNVLASAITITLFLALFPLLLISIAVLGFFLSSTPDLTSRIISSLGLTGTLQTVVQGALDHAAATRRSATLLGFLGLLWSSLATAGAFEIALDGTWQTSERNLLDKLRGLVWGVGALVLLGTSLILTSLPALISTNSIFPIPSLITSTLLFIASLALSFLFWLWTYTLLSKPRLPYSTYLPGAALATLGLELIKLLLRLLPSFLHHASVLYGSIGVVLALMAFLSLLARLTVYASILNVLLYERHYGTTSLTLLSPALPGKRVSTRAGGTKLG